MRSFISASALILAGVFCLGLISGSLRHATHLVVGLGGAEPIAVGVLWMLTLVWFGGD